MSVCCHQSLSINNDIKTTIPPTPSHQIPPQIGLRSRPPIPTTFKIFSIQIIIQLPTKSLHEIMGRDHTDFTVSPDSLPLHPSSSGSTAPLPPPNHMLGIFQPGKMKSFQSELPSVTAAQQESTRHQSSSAQTMLSRAQSNSMAPNIFPSLPTAANPYPCHGPVQSSLDKHVNSNPNEVIHQKVKHDTKDSLINPFQSNCLSVTSVQQESTSHQSSSAPTMSSSTQLVSNALISLSNTATHYPGHGTVQSSLDKDINSNPNEIIHKQVKHDTKDSLINPFWFDRLSVTSVQQENRRHQSSSAPTMSSRAQLDSMAPNALPSLWNAASHYSGHGPIQSCLGKDVNSNSNEIRHHVIKHNAKDSNDSLHGGVGFRRLDFNDNINSVDQYGYRPNNKLSHQSHPVYFHDPSNGHEEGERVLHTINENSNLIFSLCPSEKSDMENFLTNVWPKPVNAFD